MTENERYAPPRGCLYWDGRAHQLVCPDDLCRGSSRALCGLEEGIDFGLDEDDWYDEADPS